ncbi:Sulfite reductase [NADPH] subunit beta [Basidiobolus ranarum]|uniref:Sulfite reductase [NADPH] subunit beta n=1 Tax=Basidiobolus ranarum TaxID=34480 RepID=A0ABR2WI16_9FUNG
MQSPKAKSAFSKLLNGLNGPPLLILVASDGGNAATLAKRLDRNAKCRGMNSRILSMDEFPAEDLGLETNVIFIISTAGQGEFPTNGRDFWKVLSSTDLALKDTNFSVFGLGDSHYWPRPEDHIYYNKPAKDVNNRLFELGAVRFAPLGLGDDQDADGFETGYKEWEPKLWEALGVDIIEGAGPAEEPTITDDQMKTGSNFLRGSIAEGLADTTTGALCESDTKLTKFHGIYQQDDRDLREERHKQGLEKAYSFMVRVRLPGGIATPEQWLAMDDIATNLANGTLKLTTRQTFQLHGVLKRNLKSSIRDINTALMDTLAACGDVNRNVMCCPNPDSTPIHREVFEFSKNLSEHLLPRTSAYHEIWLSDNVVGGNAMQDYEPLYGSTYLPRKFKVAVAVPPSNDVDVFAHCLGYIAIVENDKLVGYNVTVGGGMGMTHNNKKTFPRIAEVMGFCTPEQAIEVGEKVMLVQRDYGVRTNRKHARLKYTIDDRGLDWFRGEVEERLGYKLEPARAYEFAHNGDRYGWRKDDNGTWQFGMYLENGRIKDTPDFMWKTGLREIAKVHKGSFLITPNQNLTLAGVTDEDLPKMKELLRQYKLDNVDHSGLRLSSMACVALPTCGLAMAESERYLPSLITKIDQVIEEAGLRDDAITIRMTGCPNGCARPYVAEIAFVGKAPGTYNLYLGGGHAGQRLNKLYKESIQEEEIIQELTPLIKHYALEREDGEKFGDFVIRKKYIKATIQGGDFHDL